MKKWDLLCIVKVVGIFYLAKIPTVGAIERRRESEANVINYTEYLDNYDIYFVDADSGDDNFTGRSPWTHGRSKLGPFQTIEGAIRKIRTLRRSAKIPVKLYVRSGFYSIQKQIQLTIKDSNFEILDYPFDTERPIFSGATRIWGGRFRQFGHLPNGLWIYRTDYDGECSPHLFINNKRFVRARKPNLYAWNGKNFAGEGPYLLIKDLLKPTEDCKRERDVFYQDCLSRNKAGFRFNDGDFVKNGTNLQQIQVLVFNAWMAERANIEGISPDNRVYFRELLREPIGTRPQPSGWRYIIENSFGDLDAAGEFYCDSVNKALFVIPPHENFLYDFLYIGTNSQIFKASGVSNITFNGIEIKYTHDDHVSWYNSKPSALELKECEGVRILNSVMGHLGHNGIVISESKNIEVYGNHFYDIGNFAVNVANPVGGKRTFSYSQDIFIANNTFDGCGVYHMLQPSCIHARGRRRIRIIGNDIRNTPYAGIKVGWQKSFSPHHTTSSDPVFYVAENHIYNFGMGILSDFAGVYLSTNVRDCGIVQRLERCHLHATITRNVIHEGRCFSYGASGIYSDSAASSVRVIDNWIYDVIGPVINFHCGQNNTASNNMIVHANPSRIFGTCNHANANGDRSRQIFSMTHNVVYVENADAMMYRKGDWWNFNVPYLNFNVYYGGQVMGRYFFPKNNSLKNWRLVTKNDLDSMIVHPRFTSRGERILSLRKTSPARELGIRSIDLLHVRNGGSNTWIFGN